jgi:urea carboxylase
VWNTWQQTKAFTDDKPWLLRFFDQIRFFPVSHAELQEWRRDFPLGRRDVRIETETFSLAAYRRFLDGNAAAIATFQVQRQAAFEAEREAWVRDKEFSRIEELLQEPVEMAAVTTVVPAGSEVLEAPLGGNVWKVNVRPGDRVARGAVIAVIEAMKMECDVAAPQAGIVRAVYVQPRQAINPGAAIVALEAQGQES